MGTRDVPYSRHPYCDPQRYALSDQTGDLAAYRRALSLDGMITQPQLYAAAGARFAIEEDLFGHVVDLMVKTRAELERV